MKKKQKLNPAGRGRPLSSSRPGKPLVPQHSSDSHLFRNSTRQSKAVEGEVLLRFVS